MKQYVIAIASINEGVKGINMKPFITVETITAHNFDEAIELLDEESAKAGYKIIKAKLIKELDSNIYVSSSDLIELEKFAQQVLIKED